MIVDRIRQTWKAAAEKRHFSGTPTGSRLGECTAALEQLMFPEDSHPEPFQPRSIGVFEFGDLLHDYLSKKIAAAFPGRWGLREQPFYFRVPIPPENVAAGACEAIQAKLRPRKPGLDDSEAWKRTPVWGWREDGFFPPKIEVTGEHKLRIRGIGVRDDLTTAHFPPSVVLDMHPADGVDPCVWVVNYIDGLILHPDLGLTLVEIKSMSDFAFRRAIAGDLEYRYQCQLASAMEAVGVQSALWVVFRKQTSHLAEIAFAPSAEGTAVTLTAPSGVADRFVVVDPKRGTIRKQGSADVEPWRPDSEWETAQTWTPALAAETLLPDMHRRVLRALTFERGGPLHREYGPDFRCARCAGEGTIQCSYCQGSGIGVKSGKVCGACGAKGKRSIGMVGRIACTPTKTLPSCGGSGVLDTVALPWQCGYCSVAVSACWAPAGVRRVIEGNRPRLLIDRTAFEASGITFTPPEPVVLEPEVEEENEEIAE